MYTHSMETIYLSLSAQVAARTFFMKSPVDEWVYFLEFLMIFSLTVPDFSRLQAECRWKEVLVHSGQSKTFAYRLLTLKRRGGTISPP